MKYYHLSGVVLIIFTELVKYLFANNPSWVEDYYANGIYLVVSCILQKISILYILPGLLTIPLLFFVFIFLALWSKQKKLVKFSLIMNSLGFLYFLFYFILFGDLIIIVYPLIFIGRLNLHHLLTNNWRLNMKKQPFIFWKRES